MIQSSLNDDFHVSGKALWQNLLWTCQQVSSSNAEFEIFLFSSIDLSKLNLIIMQHLKVIVTAHYAFSQLLSSFFTLLTLIQRPQELKSLFTDVRSGSQELFCVTVNIS